MEFSMLGLAVRRVTFPALLVSFALIAPSRAHGYIDLAPTLAKIISDSRRIAVVEVTAFNRDNKALAVKEVRALKGELSSTVMRQQVAAGRDSIPRPILQWAAVGARAVAFISDSSVLVCMGEGWYQVHGPTGGWYKLGADRPDLPLAYYGALSRLIEGVETMLAGRQVVLTAAAHGANDEAASFDLALNRMNIPGLIKVQRVRMSLRMPSTAMAAASAGLIGPGPVGPEDLPALTERLKSPDADVRAQAAEDLRWLGDQAAPAREVLAGLLGDASPRVRLASSSVLLRLGSSPERPLRVLREGTDSADPVVRRSAARQAGLACEGAGPLADKLAALLGDDDEGVRVSALQAITLMGPAASRAVAALMPLLDRPEWTIDVADALGRVGPAAAPALPRLTRMLQAQTPTVRWAAVRAMAQIGTEQATPAVEFLMQALPKATEVEGYNIMIYLSLLGPLAADAEPVIRSTRIKNPVLPSATLWAIRGQATFPWQGGGGFGRGPGGPPMGMMGDGGPDIARLIYECYFRELGPRLARHARALAGGIMDGSAGSVPVWGYRLLCCAPQESRSILVPHLSSADIVMRERAAVALGYMGSSAAGARATVQAAADRAPTQREKKILLWCLRQIAQTP